MDVVLLVKVLNLSCRFLTVAFACDVLVVAI